MGQKVHPHGLRVGIIYDWDSVWYAEKNDYVANLQEDLAIRDYLFKNFKDGFISRIFIKRDPNRIEVTIRCGRPGYLIGVKGENIKKITEYIQKKILRDPENTRITIQIEEVENIATEAQIVAQNIARQLERRISYRRAMKKAIANAMERGVKGIRVEVAGRLGGAEIARKEWMQEGRVPRHTLVADIDYGFTEALTTYGVIGVKVWIYKGNLPLLKYRK
jgi:small subunit ribosomal protein S3